MNRTCEIDTNEPVLKVNGLSTSFLLNGRMLPAIENVGFSVNKGQILAIVGESGSGKSVTCLSVLRLIQSPGKVVAGSAMMDGIDLLGLSNEEMRSVRGCKISMIFQEPMTSLNPVFPIGDQIAEAIQIHQGAGRQQALDQAVEELKRVEIANPAQRIKDYPHQMSGGMKQRVMIAMALACKPQLLIADEPTTALDVTIQAQVLDLMKRLRDELGMAILLITHDLGVVAEIAERVVVMYAGRIVEKGSVFDIFETPQHPYTKGLLNSIPTLETVKGQLEVIRGNVPGLAEMPTGCRFSPRCDWASKRCWSREPPLMPVKDGHLSACWLNRAADERN